MRSSRLPRETRPNAWSCLLAERRLAGARLLDLTEANPTRVGLEGTDVSGSVPPPAGHAAYQPDPRGSHVAREAIARYYRDRGLETSTRDIVLTASTSEAYAHLFRLLADPGDSFLVPAPSYPLFEPLAALEGVRLRQYRIAWDGAWHLDQGSLEPAIGRGARAVILVQPNHPTGSCLTGEELTLVERLCERHGAALVSDEVFGDFPWPPPGAEAPRRGHPDPATDAPGGDAGEPASLPSLLGERRVPTFVVSGLSKVCGLPQLKLSWVVAAGPEPARAEAMHGLEWIADLFLSVGSPVQAALPGLLGARHSWQARVRERIAANLARLRRGVARQPALTFLAGLGGWVAVLRVPRRRGEEEWALELLRRGVMVHPGYFYDLEGEAHLVVSLIVPTGDFGEGMGRIEELAAEG